MPDANLELPEPRLDWWHIVPFLPFVGSGKRRPMPKRDKPKEKAARKLARKNRKANRK